jgi:hypothetical protein
MTRRVPVVVTTGDPTSLAFRELVGRRIDDIAGKTGLLLVLDNHLGPEPSVLVDTGGGLSAAMHAVRGGHAAVTADLSQLVANPTEFAVLRADRRLGISAALLPGLPIAQTLIQYDEAGDVIYSVELSGASFPAVIDEALAVAALMGLELTGQDIRVEGQVGPAESAGSWQAVVRSGPPVVRPVDAAPPTEVRTATVRSHRTGDAGLTVSGPVGGPARIAAALLTDLLALAREQDTPWRAHRRQRAGVA